MDRAALPRGALEDLVERAEESRAGFRDGEPHARRPARADGQQEGEPRVLRLGVHHVDAQDAPPAAHVAADAVTTAALDVGRVEPDVGHWGARRRALGSRRAALRRAPRCRLPGSTRWRPSVLGEPGDAHLLGHPLHLAGAGGVHLGGGDEGAVHALVALDHVVREEAAGASFGMRSVIVPTHVARPRSR